MSEEYVLTYWPTRGLGQQCRAALLISGIPFKDDRMVTWYENGEGEAKHDVVAAKNPLANVPVLQTPTGQYITQTGAILKHIERVSDVLRPAGNVEAARVDETYFTLADCQGEKMKMSYGPNAKDNICSFFKESAPYYFGILDEYMKKNETKFLSSDKISISDLWLAEMFAGLVACQEKTQGKKGDEALEWARKFPRCAQVYLDVKSHPKLKELFEKDANTPFNSPTAAAWF